MRLWIPNATSVPWIFLPSEMAERLKVILKWVFLGVSSVGVDLGSDWEVAFVMRRAERGETYARRRFTINIEAIWQLFGLEADAKLRRCLICTVPPLVPV